MTEIEVVYASEHRQWKRRFPIEFPCTARLAIEQSGVLSEFPELTLDQLNIGVFSKTITLDTEVTAGQRIEIYRPLKMDPKALREQRAKKT